MCVSGNLYNCLKEVKPLVVYGVERTMVLEPVQVNRASSRLDLGSPRYFTFLR